MFNIKKFFNKKEESNEDQEVDSSLTNRIKEKEPISYFDEKKQTWVYSSTFSSCLPGRRIKED
jgi:hypothetical protein